MSFAGRKQKFRCSACIASVSSVGYKNKKKIIDICAHKSSAKHQFPFEDLQTQTSTTFYSAPLYVPFSFFSIFIKTRTRTLKISTKTYFFGSYFSISKIHKSSKSLRKKSLQISRIFTHFQNLLKKVFCWKNVCLRSRDLEICSRLNSTDLYQSLKSLLISKVSTFLKTLFFSQTFTNLSNLQSLLFWRHFFFSQTFTNLSYLYIRCI